MLDTHYLNRSPTKRSYRRAAGVDYIIMKIRTEASKKGDTPLKIERENNKRQNSLRTFGMD